jgi:7-cyano-7-deazaguanine synthase
MQNGTYGKIEIYSPFVLIDKRQIALNGKALGIDFSQTYSCYKGNELHCGKCATCTERKEALNGFDNTIYETDN